MQPHAQLVPDCHTTTWKRQDDGCRLVTIPDQSFDEPSTYFFAIPKRHVFLFRSLALMGLHQVACHADSDQERCRNDQDGRGEHLVVRPCLILIPMDFPGNFELTGMRKRGALLFKMKAVG